MDTSKFLAKIIGIYFIILSAVMIINMHYFIVYVQELIKDTPLMLVIGFWTLILGLIMVVSHNIWQWNWRTIITIISWLVFLKGASIIFYPQYIDHATTLFIENKGIAYSAAGFDLILGVLLCYLGFRR